MPRDKTRNAEEEREIRLPGLLLDKIKQKEDSGEYDEDSSRFTQFENKKRKGQPVSRKEKRQQERQLKKQKRISSKTSRKHDETASNKTHKQTPAKKEVKSILKKPTQPEEDPMAALAALKAKKAKKSQDEDPMAALAALKAKKASKSNEDDPMAALAALKAKKLAKDDPLAALAALKANKKKNKVEEFRVVKEDDLDDEDFDEEDFGEEDDDLDEDLEGFEDLDEEGDEDEENEDQDGSDFDGFELEEDISELEVEEDPLAKLKAIKEAKKAGEAKKEKESKKSKKDTNASEATVLTSQDRALFEKDDEDIEYYAKKLGIKNGKKGKLSKQDDDDDIGGLLDGLDLDFGDGFEEGDEDEDESEEYSDVSGEDSDSEESKPKKENPFVAPTQSDDSEGSEDEDSQKESKYIPPALRRKMALENDTSEEILNLRKAIKGPLNRLSEANINTITNEINGLYLTYARHSVNEQLTNLILDSIIQQGRLLDTFVYLHATLVAAIYRLQGVEFGAYFIQTLLEKFESWYKDSTKTKEASNLISLLSSVYLFSIVGSKLLYDIIKLLISDLNEINAELLLRLIRSAGNQMRSDDPSSLKEIVLLTNQVATTLTKDKLNPRTQYLIETITSLKNNKLKVNNEANHQLSIRLKKFLGSINNNKFNDPIQVSLDDIHNIETRGKWWLVGSAWKGVEKEEPTVNVEAVNDILDNAEPNWMELARSQRMNTNIRRAIFISIMSANDYIDAVTKLDKLNLKRSQEREIPRVLIHCTGVEPAWNPYYGILANKLCENHSNRKTFQFMMWDIIKEFEGSTGDDSEGEEDDFLGFDNEDDETKLKRILNLGRFFGFLLSEGALPLHILRTVNFVTASSNTVLFLEVLFFSFLDQIGKKSQLNSVGAGLGKKLMKMSELRFDDKLLIERTLKAQEQPTLLRGIEFFLTDKVAKSDLITGRKQRKRIEWGVEAWSVIIEEFLRGKEDYD
ncbi:uncharacterized protein CANTADRAFT_25712 [Suhomyces tanzawaensis NRRL Y-17324]|uniref:MI domain-containing protein n=1 Tax=Suhomyces tanzawaensis NRRL Y-17324 TaxID=984487 RepID=A0A1E4SKA2_9ASCO|nr:uncharacterized protein CANTADRAFT_25712 [Suhomyces tanzawaensis NRRL Y-17324]ODV79920.1 hypothetical protein CANTADRAFT_25712 [Suhomyces tanzawaensis NRRL Y-17324]